MCIIVTKNSAILRIWLIFNLIIELCLAQHSMKTFSCKNGEYIDNAQYCDGYLQCSDGSDEPAICSSTRTICEPGKYHCPTTDSCVDADLLSDVYVQKFCPNSQNRSSSKNETDNNLISFISTIEDILTREDSSTDTKFFCDDVRCLTVHYVCNGYCDCFNCSGENSSFPEVGIISKSQIEACSSQNKKFSCNDNKRCLNLEYVCDGYCNCFDCSDETEDCSRVDYKVLGTCPHFYFPTPQGPQCIRELGYNKFAPSSLLRIYDPNDCTTGHICDQKCTQFKTRAICSCKLGYIAIPNDNHGFRCQSESILQHALVYSTSSQIKLLNLTTAETTPVIEELVGCQILTAAHDYVYYTMYSDNRIFKHSFTSNKITEIKLDDSRDSPITSIAVDYMTENLYFTTNTTLSVCTVFGNRICMQLKCCSVNYVALAPTYGWMFYTKKYFSQGARFIMRSSMDGSEEIVLIDGRFQSITALAVDESINRLYGMTEDSKTIFSVSFIGGNSEYRMAHYQGIGLSLTALDSGVFYTVVRGRQIFTLNNNEYFTKPFVENVKITKYQNTPEFGDLLKSNSESSYLIEGEVTFEVKHLHAYDASEQRRQKIRNPCFGRNKCAGLCLLRSMNSSIRLEYTCFCDGDRSTSTTANPYWCNNSALRTSSTSSKSAPNDNNGDVTKAFQNAATKSSTQSDDHLTTTKTQKNSYISMRKTRPSAAMKLIRVHQSSHSTEVVQRHTGLEIVCVIALLVLVLCVGYLVYNKCRQYYYNITTGNFVQRQYNDNERLHIGQEEL